MFLKCLVWLGVLFDPLSFTEVFHFSKLVFFSNLISKFVLHLLGSGDALSTSDRFCKGREQCYYNINKCYYYIYHVT